MSITTIDMTPSWTETGRMLAMLTTNGTEEGRAKIAPEVERMGKIIDDLQAELRAMREAQEDTAEVDHLFTQHGEGLPWVEAPGITDTFRGTFVSVDLPVGYDTVLGYLARVNPWALQADLWDPEATKRDGFWCKHRACERGIRVVKVEASEVLQDQGIYEVNAYPVSLLSERMGD